MLPRASVAPDGSLYVIIGAAGPNDVRVGGVLVTPEGSIHVNGNAPQKFDQGKGFMSNGDLCLDLLGEPAVGYVGGLPVTATGAIKAQLNQPVSPGDAFVGGIRVGPLGGVYVTNVVPDQQAGFSNGYSDGFDAMSGGTPVWSPAELFAAGEQGVWYDPSDFSTMFQDSAGTTPVTAVGQPVGKINDKSGKNNHASQATAASRPVLQQDGNGKYYLAFDGVDDSLATAAIDFTATDKMSVFGGYLLSSGTNKTLCSVGSSSAGSFNTLASSDPLIRASLTGLSANVQTSIATSAANNVVTQLYDLAQPTATTAAISRDNGTQPTQNEVLAGNPGGGNFASSALLIGDWNGFLFFGRIYSLIVRGAASSPQEITDTETWVNGKTGAY
jgi:hypothetical protein